MLQSMRNQELPEVPDELIRAIDLSKQRLAMKKSKFLPIDRICKIIVHKSAISWVLKIRLDKFELHTFVCLFPAERVSKFE